MKDDKPHTADTFEHAIRSAILAQLTHSDVVDALTQAILERLESQENSAFLALLQKESANDQENIRADEFLKILRQHASSSSQ